MDETKKWYICILSRKMYDINIDKNYIKENQYDNICQIIYNYKFKGYTNTGQKDRIIREIIK